MVKTKKSSPIKSVRKSPLKSPLKSAKKAEKENQSPTEKYSMTSPLNGTVKSRRSRNDRHSSRNKSNS